MYEALLLFGALLIILELFIPGGVAGTIGALLAFYAIAQITSSVQSLIIAVIVFLSVSGCILYFLGQLISKDKINNRLILKSKLDSESGFNSNAKPDADMIGKRGITISVLRPAGKIKIAGEIYFVISEDKYVDKDKQVEVVRFENNEIIVREVFKDEY